MKKKSNKLAKILYAPQYPVKYNTDKLSSGAVATVGSYIVVHKNGIIPLEHEIHRSFLGRQVNPCIVAQRDVMAIVPPELIDKVK